MNYTYLLFGDHLPSVGVLQKLLNRAGANLVVDGIFRDKTRAAVLKFQAARCRRRDGLVGIETWERLTEGLDLPIVDCVDIFDSVEKSECLQRDATRGSKFHGLLNRTVLDRMQYAELLKFANEIEAGDESLTSSPPDDETLMCSPGQPDPPKLDKKRSPQKAPELPLALMNKQQLLAAITKKLAEDRKETAEWADSYAYEADDIKTAGGNPFLIGGMSDGIEQAVSMIVNAAKGAFLLRFHAHGGEGGFSIGKGREGDQYGNRISKDGLRRRWFTQALVRLRGRFGPYGSVELFSCSFMSGPDGLPMLKELAILFQVPVTAAVTTQYGGGTATFRFEGPTVTALPNGGTLRDWCRSLPDFPRQNASFHSMIPGTPSHIAGRPY